MSENTGGVKVQVTAGEPNATIGLPAVLSNPEAWRDGLLFVMRVDGSRVAWLEPYGDAEGDGRRGGIRGVARRSTSPSTVKETVEP